MTAMALPVLFAACTNEELEVAGNGDVAQTERRVVEDVTLNFNLSGNEDSRLAYNGSYSWQKNDEIGACLMDVINDDEVKNAEGEGLGYTYYNAYTWGGATWARAFDFVDHIHTNYKFTHDGNGVWSTEAKMCEGNYFCYYPYDANAGLRDAYALDREIQYLANTTTSALKDAYVKNNAFVGYSKVVAGDNEKEALNISMVPAFGATGITIKNTGTDTYKIEKIVLRGDQVYNYAVINPTTCTKDLQYHSSQTNFVKGGKGLVKENSFNVAQYVKSSSEAWHHTWGQTGSVSNSYDADWSGYDKIEAMKDALDYYNVGDLQVVIAAGNVVKPQGSINVIAMTKQIKAIETAVLGSDGEWTNGNEIILDIHTDKGLIRDIKLNYHYTSTNGSMQDDASITNVLTDKAIAELGYGKSITVTFDDTSLDTPKTMDVNTNDELANLIHWNAKSSAPIKANLKTNVTITKAMYNELVGGNITTAEINGDNQFNVTIAENVPAGALDRFTFTDVATIKVYGTQTLAVAKTSPIYVYGTLNITGNKSYAGITNEGVVNINKKQEGEYTLTNNKSGVVNVAAGVNVTSSVNVVNGCYHWSGCHVPVVNNSGTIMKMTNQYWGVVNNEGQIGKEAQVGSIDGNVNNSATINNNGGKLFVYENTGKVYANGKSTTRMEENNGYIIITKLDENDGNFLAGTMGNIVQEIAEPTNTDGVDVRANMLWLSSTLKVEKTNADGEYVDVNLNKTAKNGQVQVVATGKNARIEGNGQKLTMSHITVNGNAKLVLNKIDVYNYVNNGDDAWVYMKGSSSAGVATITINNNASLTTNVNEGGITASQENSYNVIDNNSSSTTIGVDDDAVVNG